MKLKGNCKISILDAETGKVLQEEEHSNTITPALAKIFQSNLSGTLNYNELCPLYTKLLGGVCLFSGTVDPTSVFLPSADNAVLTAHAGQDTYSDPADDPKRGLPSASSQPVPNGYKWVFEWAQTQGNSADSITDVVLTHSDTGSYWSEDADNSMADFEPLADVSTHILKTYDFTYDTGDYGVHRAPQLDNQERIPIGFWDGDLNQVVSVKPNLTTDKLEVYISKFTGDGVWMWNDLGEPYGSITLPFTAAHAQSGSDELKKWFRYAIAYDETAKKIYAFWTGEVSQQGVYTNHGRNLNIEIFNLTTGEAETPISLSRGTAGDFWFGSDNSNEMKQLAVVNGNVFLPLYDPDVYPFQNMQKSYRVNLNDTTDCEEVNGLYGIFVNGGAQDSLDGQLDLGNGRIMNPDNFAAKDKTGAYKGYTIQRSTGVDSLFGFGMNTARVYVAKPTASPIQFFTYAGYDADNTSSLGHTRGCVLNKLFAATVYHLTGSFVKNSSQTMRVEYTITQEEES